MAGTVAGAGTGSHAICLGLFLRCLPGRGTARAAKSKHILVQTVLTRRVRALDPAVRRGEGAAGSLSELGVNVRFTVNATLPAHACATRCPVLT
eukprot:1079041-Rhodomonas_salina.1